MRAIQRRFEQWTTFYETQFRWNLRSRNVYRVYSLYKYHMRIGHTGAVVLDMVKCMASADAFNIPEDKNMRNLKTIRLKEVKIMREGIHPDYHQATVTCNCGNTFVTGSTKESIHVEICSKCHPFYTGQQKSARTDGRIDKFNRKYGIK